MEAAGVQLVEKYQTKKLNQDYYCSLQPLGLFAIFAGLAVSVLTYVVLYECDEPELVTSLAVLCSICIGFMGSKERCARYLGASVTESQNRLNFFHHLKRTLNNFSENSEDSQFTR